MTRRAFTLQLYDRPPPVPIVAGEYRRIAGERPEHHRLRITQALGSKHGIDLDSPVMKSLIDQIVLALEDSDVLVDRMLREQRISSARNILHRKVRASDEREAIRNLMRDNRIQVTNGTVTVTAGAGIKTGGTVEYDGVKIGTAMHDVEAGEMLRVRLGGDGPADMCKCGRRRFRHGGFGVTHDFELGMVPR